ncbi:Maf family protein [Acetobacter oeni]|uniref:Nucleoside triphosphate pyrophosphatase n=1 Tax=Acetobacter oeni TaxID=304077 RepID=A0A511XLV3_9PROT|nr:Maf family protein [Acetobacter oeni]MBB3882956.1 septum formation protein [Acetobacter oeni]NHO19038.1 Maf-like protein [Acetobacter oeni]GBR09266.1 septum formation inhibitor nucleotide-binding protein Maf [Acetobacter oeni LMG 21952]GEN63922.1 Maf-like protein R00002 [Acetobacter oeni]
MIESSADENEVLTPLKALISTDLVLASGSAARAALLTGSGLPFTVQAAEIDERVLKEAGRAAGDTPGTVALRLAAAKALDVSGRHADPDAVITGADQMLSCEGVWFDKPGSHSEARDQLMFLRGRTHYLHSAVVLCRGESVFWQHVSTCALTMRAFSDTFTDMYFALDGGACLSCVGAYRVEGPGVHLFERIEGDYSAILGLPMLPLLQALRAHGILAG